MKFILGIGHCEKDKCLIRHNAGYQVLDWLCQKYEVDLQPEKWDFFHCVETKINDKDVMFGKLCVPSHEIGNYLAKLLKIWKIEIRDLIVIHDDQNIDFGKVIISCGKKGGNHTAIDSIMIALNTNKFTRVRIGVGTHSQPNNRKYLLGPYSDKQYKKLPKIFEQATNIIEEIIIKK